MDKSICHLISEFVKERVDSPQPKEIEIWSQLVYAGLFSAGFVVWLKVKKNFLSPNKLNQHLNKFISEIAENADGWINRKIKDALRNNYSNINVDGKPEIRFHLGAMFNEAICVMCDRNFKPEVARSHACFVHLSKNLQRLALTGKLEFDVKNVLQLGVEGTDAMAQKFAEILKRKRLDEY